MLDVDIDEACIFEDAKPCKYFLDPGILYEIRLSCIKRDVFYVKRDPLTLAYLQFAHTNVAKWISTHECS